MDLFQASYDSLKIALDRFASCRQSLDELGSEAQGGEILVPLSSSVYVPGNLSDISRATVDIGAGYYVEKVFLLYPPSFSPSLQPKSFINARSPFYKNS